MGMDLGFVQRATGAHWQAEAAATRPVTAVSHDTRTLTPGALYVAIQGENHDGHDFVPQALAAGCAGILAERAVEAGDTPVLIAPEGTLTALGKLAAAWRERIDPLVIGITGSSGKTTLKEMVAACLKPRFRVHATKGNLNNHIGVPLTLLAMPEETQILVAELGMSAPGEIAALAALARPRIGVVTNVQAAHIEFFGSLAGIARAKGELLEALPREEGLAIFPADSPYTHLLRGMARCRVRTFGLEVATDPDALAVEIVEGGEGQSFVIRRVGGDLAVELGMPGSHMVKNALAACETALAAGATADEVVGALAGFQPPEGRGRVKRNAARGWSVIDDTYNANPGSMAASLRALGQRKGSGRRVAVLGDMLELGEDGAALHAGLAQVALESRVDLLLLAGPRMAALKTQAEALGLNVRHKEDPAAWVGEIATLLGPGETILVKGSRGMRMERIVAALLEHNGGDRIHAV